MLLAATQLSEALRESLRAFNIRTVEQLVSVANSRRRLYLLARAVGLNEKDLLEQISFLQGKYPDAVVPKDIPKKRYPLGYRLEAGQSSATDDGNMIRSATTLTERRTSPDAKTAKAG